MKVITVKFGGTSLADASQFEKVAGIIKSDPDRRYVVASAPGKRFKEDIKVTDLLYRCHDLAAAGEDYHETLEAIRERFAEIIRDLGMTFDLTEDFAGIEKHLQGTPSRDYMASRGEYLNSKILAAYLGFSFFDPAGGIRFTEEGKFEAELTNSILETALSKYDHAVIPGFYGATAGGKVHTFSRGGSDITGSLVARATSSDVYENWTDVSGMLFTDPRIVENPRTIEYVTYRELRELSYMGASVLHEDAIFPVRKAGIPINIRNTNRPQDKGTMIVQDVPEGIFVRTITGIAGKKGFTSIRVEKSQMNTEVGFGARLLSMIAEYGISFEHCPTGIDMMSVIVSTEELIPVKEELEHRIWSELRPDTVDFEENMALVAVVGNGMRFATGYCSRIFRSLGDAGINIRMIDSGAGEINIIIGVFEKDFEESIRTLEREFR